MKRYQVRVPGSIPKDRLDLYLLIWLPTVVGMTLSKANIRALLFSGSVFVNRNRRKSGSTPIYSGALIEVYFDEEKLNQNSLARVAEVRFDSSRIVYEDEFIIVVDKPAGLPTQPTIDPNRVNLYDSLKQMLSHRDKVDVPYLGLHHRLDKDTSGLILFTKKEEANKGVSELFLNHAIQKTYQCICWRAPDSRQFKVGDQFQVENHLGKISDKSDKTKFGQVRSGGDHAITDFTVIEVFRDMVWLSARPKTGRTHQIRVHASENLLPILGDPMYFPEKIALFMSAPRLMLHAIELRFLHPINQVALVLNAELPSDFVDTLGQLKR